MPITYKYDLTFIGLGDLTFFCGEMLIRMTKEDTLMININDITLDNYRDGSKSYKKFCIDYVKFLLSDYNVIECEPNIETDRRWELNIDYIDRMFSEPNVRNILKSKFSNKTVETFDSNYVVLFTKVRDYNRVFFDSISKQFYSKLNSIDSKILLIGEKKVQYTGEYKKLGSNTVYSLYNDFIENIDSDKIIDLTQNNFAPNNINLENILHDLSIISNSKNIIMIGCGGFFCTSLFTDKLLSLSNENVCRQFKCELNNQVFLDYNIFLHSI
jgi:hypothetical protein